MSHDTRVTLTCQQCGKTYLVKRNRAAGSRFHSNECKHQYQREHGLDDRICEQCGKTYHSKYKVSRFCDRECLRDWHEAQRAAKWDQRPETPPGMRWCRSCHVIKPVEDFSLSRGSHDGYRNDCKLCARERFLREKNERLGLPPNPPGFRTCNECEQVKPLEQFHRNKQMGDGYDSRCSTCANAKHQAHRDANPDLIIERSRRNYARHGKEQRQRQNSRRTELRSWFLQVTAERSCERCGENDPACLDFHHVNPEEKILGPREMVTRGFTEDAILSELAKCMTLCSNCHRKLHRADLGFGNTQGLPKPLVPLKEERRRRRVKQWVGDGEQS